ncbi:DNA translocase FtsK [Pseudomonas viridiflava]|uniref:DNA translocase FtsK n=1 Tax=Pseudomonas viridiflava TaxID=33069 RepID=UPI0013CEC859|nr:DNA translocase FtsK [Pseudomonas viridiflava]
MSNDKKRGELLAAFEAHKSRIATAIIGGGEGARVRQVLERVSLSDFEAGWQASREALEQSAISPEVQAMLSQFEADEAEEIRMAEAYVRESERCSISALQRKFKIGYNRACRLMDRLVALKVVSPIDAEGRRTVLPEQVKP